jgi:hypothetical protein
MITNVDYLIQKYADAREKMLDAGTYDAEQYWRGAMDTYHNVLYTAFDDWAAPGTTGYYVFYEQLSYEEALDQVVKEIQLEQVKRGY